MKSKQKGDEEGEKINYMKNKRRRRSNEVNV